ncbi:putative SUMO-activating enzyme subunit 1 [Apostichopus japonicus]|uniref:SUMO-activating enzyme subunit 1 n=1 Tax=Stichopus japonicus TaxID=307972 RepID=A0A2G8LR06_STIJA|nr:putative SUMO-activating enzyme subunit 1 [Apostichopus japonicus]
MANQDQLITEDEAELYDRQIRLWGLDAQKRLRVTKMLLVGLGGLGAEVCKNIVLAGIKSITLMDDQNVTEADFFSQFLITREEVGKNRATASVARVQELNPNVIVTSDETSVTDKEEAFFKQFDIVCLTYCKPETIVKVNTFCHENNIQFFGGDIFGFYGYSFSDLNEHNFVEEKPKKIKGSSGEGPSKKQKVDATETVFIKRTMHFTRFKEALEKNGVVYPRRK